MNTCLGTNLTVPYPEFQKYVLLDLISVSFFSVEYNFTAKYI